MTYADLAATMLAAVSVIVTVLGVVIAILALWGFRHFREVAEQTANAHVEGKLEDITEEVQRHVMTHVIRDIESGRIKDILEKRADYFLKYGAQVRSEESEWEGDEEKEYGA